MTNSFKFGSKSLKTLEGVDPVLKLLCEVALHYSEKDFSVYSGKRSATQQHEMFLKGASKLDGFKRKSMHQHGLAVDLVPLTNNKGDWRDSAYDPIVAAFDMASNALGVEYNWGGEWRTFKDCPHFELTKAYKKYEYDNIKYKADVVLQSGA